MIRDIDQQSLKVDEHTPWPNLKPITGRIPRRLKVTRTEETVYIRETRQDGWLLLLMFSLLSIAIGMGFYWTDPTAPDALSAAMTAYLIPQIGALAVIGLGVIPRYRRLEYHQPSDTYHLRPYYFKLPREGEQFRGEAVIVIADYAAEVTETHDLSTTEQIISGLLFFLEPLGAMASFIWTNKNDKKVVHHKATVPALIAVPYGPDGSLADREATVLLPCRKRNDCELAMQMIGECQRAKA